MRRRRKLLLGALDASHHRCAHPATDHRVLLNYRQRLAVELDSRFSASLLACATKRVLDLTADHARRSGRQEPRDDHTEERRASEHHLQRGDRRTPPPGHPHLQQHQRNDHKTQNQVRRSLLSSDRSEQEHTARYEDEQPRASSAGFGDHDHRTDEHEDRDRIVTHQPESAEPLNRCIDVEPNTRDSNDESDRHQQRRARRRACRRR